MGQSTPLKSKYQIQFIPQLLDCSASFLSPLCPCVLGAPNPTSASRWTGKPSLVNESMNPSGYCNWMKDGCQMQSGLMKYSEAVWNFEEKGTSPSCWVCAAAGSQRATGG